MSSEIGTCESKHYLLQAAIPMGVVLTTAEGSRIIKANQAFCDYIEFDEAEITGRSVEVLNLLPDPGDRIQFLRMLDKNKTVDNFPVMLKRKNGTYIDFLCSITLIDASHMLFLLYPHADAGFTDKNRLVGKDKKIVRLEKKLEKMDAALEMMSKKLQRIEHIIKERTNNPLTKKVLMLVEKARCQSPNDKALAYLAAIEKNLTKIACRTNESSPFSQYDFTANEIRILELIKQGKRSKEIADLLNLSLATIAYHRNNIRKKLGIINKKENLFSRLQSLVIDPAE